MVLRVQAPTRATAERCGRAPAPLGSPSPSQQRRPKRMFVFKAAVVGAGTMGGQIAQTIAAAGIPVVLKDIDEALVQAGLVEAENVTRGQIGKLAERGK